MRIRGRARAPFRLRLLFRGAFLLLALATVAMAVFLLQQEQRLSRRGYEDGFRKNAAQIAARLRHPTGQLALLNPAPATSRDPHAPTRLHPLLLPFAALDFDDRGKVQQAIEMSGCRIEYPDGSDLCVAIGSSPRAGSFIYAAGSFATDGLVDHPRGARDLGTAHRLKVAVDLRGESYRWIAPYEHAEADDPRSGRLTAFLDDGTNLAQARPQREFRGWLWQDADCARTTGDASASCPHRAFFSVRLPIAVLRDEALAGNGKPVWPPADLDRIEVAIRMLPPGDGAPLFDSAAANATLPFALTDLTPLLLPGETLRVRHAGDDHAPDLALLRGTDDAPAPTSHLLSRLLRRFVLDRDEAPVEDVQTIVTATGRYELLLSGDARGVDAQVSAVATRVAGFVAAILLAILLVWLVIEIGVIRRITLLTRRAQAVSNSMNDARSLDGLDLRDLRGGDELGVLAAALGDLLQRVQENVDRERIRAQQEKDQWHAVGHEIMSPLQSLMVLHGDERDRSRRYIERMQQAVRVLYGSASPSEAFQSTQLQLEPVDLGTFLADVARNAPHIGIESVRYAGPDAGVRVRASEHALEDVIGHVLHNAQRHRNAATPITMTLLANEQSATVTIDNQGPRIDPALLDTIFEYGVSAAAAGSGGGRGQGLFVARTYMAKMAGTITAQNLDDGVRFILGWPRIAP